MIRPFLLYKDLHVILGTAIVVLDETPEFPLIADAYHFPRGPTARDVILLDPNVAHCVRQGIRTSDRSSIVLNM